MKQNVYDERPFDWVEPGQAEQTYPPLFSRFLETLPRDSIRCEIGCGAGRNLVGLGRGARLAIGVDLSLPSARRAHSIAKTAQADALNLPFPDGRFDVVVLDGVAHHTGNTAKAIDEALRITRPGGLIYVAIYKKGTLYSYLYRTLGRWLRVAGRSGIGRFVNTILALWVYRPIHYFKRGVWRTPEAARNLYSDYFLTPIASFHTREEITSWISGAGGSVQEVDEFPNGNCRLFIAERESA